MLIQIKNIFLLFWIHKNTIVKAIAALKRALWRCNRFLVNKERKGKQFPLKKENLTHVNIFSLKKYNPSIKKNLTE